MSKAVDVRPSQTENVFGDLQQDKVFRMMFTIQPRVHDRVRKPMSNEMLRMFGEWQWGYKA